LLGEIHQIFKNQFSMQMSPKTVKYGGKTWVSATDGFCKNLGFSVSFEYRNNTKFNT